MINPNSKRGRAMLLAAQAQAERDAGRDPTRERAVVDFDELKKAFDVHGIEIPFPQRTVWVNTVTDRTKADVAGTEGREDLLERRSGGDGEE